MINVIIVDDQDIVRDGLSAILSAVNDVEVVGTASNGAEAIDLVEKFSPDVVLMDLKMPVMNGIEATYQIHTNFPNAKVLVLTTFDADEWVFDAIRSGAKGYLLKDTPREQLLEAIRGTAAGESHITPSVATTLLSHIALQEKAPESAVLDSLTDREREILILLARGYSNQAISDELYLSHGTVRNYLSTIFEKLDVSDRTQAALMALRYGLIE